MADAWRGFTAGQGFPDPYDINNTPQVFYGFHGPAIPTPPARAILTERPTGTALWPREKGNDRPASPQARRVVGASASWRGESLCFLIITLSLHPAERSGTPSPKVKRCKCGSSTHERTNHKDCRLNKNNTKQDGNEVPSKDSGRWLLSWRRQSLCSLPPSFMEGWLHDGCCCCQGSDLERFNIKIPLRLIIRDKKIRPILGHAISRYNRIVFEGVLFATFHNLRLFEAGKASCIRLDTKFYRHCFQAVSLQHSSHEKPNPPMDAELAKSAEAYLAIRGADVPFQHREDISQALGYAAIKEMASLQVHVKVHLAGRIKKWLVLQLRNKLDKKGIGVMDLREMAGRIVSRIEHDEEEEEDATAEEEKKNKSPWVKPESAQDLLDKDWADRRFAEPSLKKTVLEATWQVWSKLLSHLDQAKLPLCPSNFDKKDGWKDYFPLLYKLLKDMEDAGDPKEDASAEPAGRPTLQWARFFSNRLFRLIWRSH